MSRERQSGYDLFQTTGYYDTDGPEPSLADYVRAVGRLLHTHNAVTVLRKSTLVSVCLYIHKIKI
jgi:hypothetical protein